MTMPVMEEEKVEDKKEDNPLEEAVKKEEQKIEDMFEIKSIEGSEEDDDPLKKDIELRGKKKEEEEKEEEEKVVAEKEGEGGVVTEENEKEEEIEKEEPPKRDEKIYEKEVQEKPFNRDEFNERILKGLVDNPFGTINEILDHKIVNDKRFQKIVVDLVMNNQNEIQRESQKKAEELVGKMKGKYKDFDQLVPEINKIKRGLDRDELQAINSNPEGGMSMLIKMARAITKKKAESGIDIDDIPSAGSGKGKGRDNELSELEERIRIKQGMTKEEYIALKD